MALFLLGGDWWQHDELMALYPPGLGCLAESKTWRGGDSGGAAAGWNVRVSLTIQSLQCLWAPVSDITRRFDAGHQLDQRFRRWCAHQWGTTPMQQTTLHSEQ